MGPKWGQNGPKWAKIGQNGPKSGILGGWGGEIHEFPWFPYYKYDGVSPKGARGSVLVATGVLKAHPSVPCETTVATRSFRFVCPYGLGLHFAPYGGKQYGGTPYGGGLGAPSDLAMAKSPRNVRIIGLPATLTRENGFVPIPVPSV